MRNALLRTERLRRGWTQQQLADFAGISLSTVERAENSADGLAALRFGYPTPIQLPDGQVRIVGQLVEKITPDQFHF